MKKINCSINSVEKLNYDVYKVKLLLPANTQENGYKAGQYLDLYLPSGKGASFSIASAPEAGQDLELHIRHNPESEHSTAVIEYLKSAENVDVELGKGLAFIEAKEIAHDDVIVLVAASTGFSQVKSVVEHLISNKLENEIHVYWGVRVAADLYWNSLPEKWAKENSNVTYHSVVSDPTDVCEWNGRIGLLPTAIMEDFGSFKKVKMLASGSPDMVYALQDACEEKELMESQLSSDVFSYAPRNKK